MRLQSPAPTLPDLLRPQAGGIGSPAFGLAGRKDGPHDADKDFSRHFEPDGGLEPSVSTGNEGADRLVEAASSAPEEVPEDTPGQGGAVSADDSQDLPRPTDDARPEDGRDRTETTPGAGPEDARTLDSPEVPGSLPRAVPVVGLPDVPDSTVARTGPRGDRPALLEAAAGVPGSTGSPRPVAEGPAPILPSTMAGVLNSALRPTVDVPGDTASRPTNAAGSGTDAPDDLRARLRPVSIDPRVAESIRAAASRGPEATSPPTPPSGEVPVDQERPDGARPRGAATSDPSRSGALARLLESHAAEVEPARRSGATDPAVGRAREVQQSITRGEAAPVPGRSLPTAAPAPSASSAPTGTAVPAEGRSLVLGEVLARTASESRISEQATQATARGLGALASQKGGALNLRLNPSSLGEVTIRMSVVEGVVRADLVTTSSTARAMLEGGLDVLRGAMESRGLTVDRLVVHTAHAAGEQSGARPDQQGASSQGGAREQGGEGSRQDAAGRESRGRGEQGRDDSGREPRSHSGDRTSFVHVMDEEST
ncbi:MAG: flagellar hook-length control protein FliK [Planctomycetota bacterium]|nr:flagellar hook-length control protein FliK [Planctomycetota bacterium]